MNIQIQVSTMKFCENCFNMLYINVSNDNLKYYCKNCAFSIEESFATKAECILDTNHNIDEATNYKQYMTRFIKYDPTLPRVSNIDCPNAECTRDKKEENKVIYVKHDHINMKYMYYCCHCEHFWR